MRDKEWLLSFECPLRFIFSHSALKEGWDNPNVFQVCTLIEQKSTFTCRQKVGRGLRLCVNQDGERIEDRNINILHVMANESFAEFASTLQKEIEDETGANIEQAEVSYTEKHIRSSEISGTYQVLPDIIRLISSETLLSRRTVIKIINGSGRIKDFINNPQAFLEKAMEIITRNRHNMAIDGIKYVKLAGEEYYAQEIFDSDELIAYIDKNAVKVEHSVYDYVLYDSKTVEKPFAEKLDEDPDVKMFFKIPDKFKIETPIGSYNPDWAVFLEKDGEQKLYFILETKGTTSLFDLRPTERLKINCGRKHFEALDGVEFSELPVKDWTEFKVNL